MGRDPAEASEARWRRAALAGAALGGGVICSPGGMPNNPANSLADDAEALQALTPLGFYAEPDVITWGGSATTLMNRAATCAMPALGRCSKRGGGNVAAQ